LTYFDTMPSAPSRGVREHHVAVLGDVVVEHDPGFGSADQVRQRSLALQERAAAQVDAVELDQIEATEHRALGTVPSQLIELRDPVGPDHRRLAIDREAMSFECRGDGRDSKTGRSS
jgi:hypothetical protein